MIGLSSTDQNSFTEINTNSIGNEDFFYVVRANASQGNSLLSNEVVILATPKRLNASSRNGNAAVKLKWRDLSNSETGYVLERAEEHTDFTELAHLAPNTERYTDNSAILGNTYYYHVKAVAPNGFSTYSNIAEVVSGNNQTPSNELEANLEIYPNPATEYFIVTLKDLTGRSIKVELLSGSGEIINSQFLGEVNGRLQASFKLAYLKPDIYFVRVSDDKNTITRRVVIDYGAFPTR